MRERYAIIVGSGFPTFTDGVDGERVTTPYGEPSAPVRRMSFGPCEVLVLPRHGDDHTLPPHVINYRANAFALRSAGANAIVALNTVGVVSKVRTPGSLAVPDQLLDYTWGREHTYSDSGDVPLAHVDFTRPYEGALRRSLVEAAKAASVDLVDGGCIGVFQGPRLESAAEIERARRDGCDMAGMTALPEAGLAR